MNHDIPLKYFDIADEYATECAEPVAEAERTPLAHYFQLLLTRLMNNEEISRNKVTINNKMRRKVKIIMVFSPHPVSRDTPQQRRRYQTG